MKIYIKLNSGFSFFIPVPIGLVKASLSISSYFTSSSVLYIQENHKKYVECIDLNELKKGMDVLKDYKGLKMLDLKSKDGAEIKIVVWFLIVNLERIAFNALH